jgi:hypothetical protein
MVTVILFFNPLLIACLYSLLVSFLDCLSFFLKQECFQKSIPAIFCLSERQCLLYKYSTKEGLRPHHVALLCHWQEWRGVSTSTCFWKHPLSLLPGLVFHSPTQADSALKALELILWCLLVLLRVTTRIPGLPDPPYSQQLSPVFRPWHISLFSPDACSHDPPPLQ